MVFGAQTHNKFNNKQLILFGGSSIVFTLLIAIVLLAYSNSVVQAREDVTVDSSDSEIAFGTVSLWAPKERISGGTRVTVSHLTEVHWPRDQVPQGAIRSAEEIEGMFAKVQLPANQPVSRASLSMEALSQGIGELLPEGHRAVTIDVDAISGVEGWATPGAHVDVYLTYKDPKEKVYKTRVAVEDAVVLSYGGASKKKTDFEAEKTKVESTVTLAVAFEDSLKIQTAKAMGRITLALRNSGDIKSHGKGEFSANDWDDPEVKTKKNFKAKGFASISGASGETKQFILGEDNRWWKDAEEEE